MKKNLLLLAFLFTFFACDKDNDSSEGKDIIVTDSKQLTQTVYADEVKGSSGVSFSTTGTWTSTITEKGTKATASPTPSWVSIDPKSGDKAGNYTVNISLGVNDTGKDRMATITIVCGESKTSITVTQKGNTESGETPQNPSKYNHFVSKITLTSKEGLNDDYTENKESSVSVMNLAFTYDLSKRVTKVTGKKQGEATEQTMTFTYLDGEIIYEAPYDEESEGGDDYMKMMVNTLYLNEDGFIKSGSRDNASWEIEYKDGYIVKSEGESIYTDADTTEIAPFKHLMTWTGGNMTKVTDVALEAYDTDWIANATYGKEINNPLVNIDVNWIYGGVEPWDFIVNNDDSGDTSLLMALGFYGKRSANLMATNKEMNRPWQGGQDRLEEFKYEYEIKDNLVTTITIKPIKQEDSKASINIIEISYK